MGNTEAKLAARKTFLDITITSSQKFKSIDWDNLFSLRTSSLDEIFTLMPLKETRLLRDSNPRSLTHLFEAATETLLKILCPNDTDLFYDYQQPTDTDFNRLLTIIRIFIRLLPVVHENTEQNQFIRLSEEFYSKTTLALKSLMFFSNFTIQPKTEEKLDNTKKFYEGIWGPGIGFCKDVEISLEMQQNRTEVLYLLLMLLQVKLFHVDDIDWDLPFCVSLLNSALTTEPSSVETTKYVKTCFMSLNILIAQTDSYASFIRRIHNPSDFKFLLTRLNKLYRNANFIDQSFSFTYLLLSNNKNYLSYCLETTQNIPNCSDLVTSLGLYFYDSKHSRVSENILLGLKILSLLSQNQAFGISLNSKFHFVTNLSKFQNYKATTLIPKFSGNFFDFIVLTCSEIPSNSQNNYLLMKFLVNLSCFIRNLSMTASELYFSKIFQRDQNFGILITSNIIQYQFDTNTNFIYSLITKKKLFLNSLQKNYIIQLTLDHLLPRIEELHKDKKIKDYDELLDFVKNNTLVGVLPARPIVEIEKFYAQIGGWKIWMAIYLNKYLVSHFSELFSAV